MTTVSYKMMIDTVKKTRNAKQIKYNKNIGNRNG